MPLRMKPPRSIVLAAVAAGFVLLLLYATFRSTPVDQGPDAEDRGMATDLCQHTVRERLAGARFPFSPNVKDLGGGRLQLSGSVDSGDGAQAERRNYECFVTRSSSTGAYVADSVEVWQSH
jgi:hypothetical protein